MTVYVCCVLRQNIAYLITLGHISAAEKEMERKAGTEGQKKTTKRLESFFCFHVSDNAGITT